MKKVLCMVLMFVMMISFINANTVAAMDEIGIGSIQLNSDAGETMSSATRLPSDKYKQEIVVSDQISSTSDVDWFKFTLPEDGVFNVSFVPSSQPSSKYGSWGIGIYSSDGTQLLGEEYVDNNYWFGKYPYKKGTTFYIMVKNCAGWATDTTVLSKTYSICYSFYPSSSQRWETENNDSIGKADVMKVNTMYYGNIWDTDTADYYKVTAPMNGVLQFSVRRRPEVNPNSWFCWTVSVYDKTGHILETFKTDNYQYSNKIKCKKGQTVYFRVTGDSYTEGTDYQVIADFTPSETFSSITAYQKSAILKWKPTTVTGKNIGYQIQYSTNPKFTKSSSKCVYAKSKTASVKKIINLKRHTKYYVRIRTFRKSFYGNNRYGSWSTVKSFTTK